MSKTVYSMLALLLITGCTPTGDVIDLEKEKEAIKAVLEAETNAFFARDLDQQLECFVQDESTTAIAAGDDGLYSGWEAISKGYKGIYERVPDPIVSKVEYKNYKIKVYGNSAWAVYDEYYIFENDSAANGQRAIRFLEKVDDEWKIVLLTNHSRAESE